MKLLRTLILTVLAVALGSFAFADVSTTVTPSFVSNYMFRGQQLSGAALQPSVEVDAGNLAVGIWASNPLSFKTFTPEVDPYLTYTYMLGDLSIVPGITIYTYPKAVKSDGSYVYSVEPNLAISYKHWGVTFTPKAYYDTVLHAATGELSLGYSVPLFSTELDLTAQGGQYRILDTVRDSLPRTKSWGDYYLVGFSVPFQLNKATKLSWGYSYTGGYVDSKQGKARQETNSSSGRGVVSLNLSRSF